MFTENFLIAGAGIEPVVVHAVLANLGLMKDLDTMSHISLYVPLLGALMLWLLGQLAAWGSARYADRVSPIVAIRSE